MCPQFGPGWTKEAIRRVQLNFTFEILAEQNKIRPETPTFKCEKVELVQARDGSLTLVGLQSVEPPPGGSCWLPSF